MNKNIVIFLGPPGAGKGSLSKLCSKKLGWVQFSTGNVCRQHISEGTEIGKQIDFTIKSGKLISDGLVSQIVADWLYKQVQSKSPVILDGFPRTKAQAIELNNILTSSYMGSVNLNIVKMVIPDASIISRLSARYICENNKCQAVYSMDAESLKPKKEFICDECSSVLIRRADDEQSAILKRLKIYYDHEKDLIDFYTNSGVKINNLEVEKPLEHIFENLVNLIG